jgi:hypothetical protein
MQNATKKKRLTFVTDISVLAVRASLGSVFPLVLVAGAADREATMHTSNKWLGT